MHRYEMVTDAGRRRTPHRRLLGLAVGAVVAGLVAASPSPAPAQTLWWDLTPASNDVTLPDNVRVVVDAAIADPEPLVAGVDTIPAADTFDWAAEWPHADIEAAAHQAQIDLYLAAVAQAEREEAERREAEARRQREAAAAEAARRDTAAQQPTPSAPAPEADAPPATEPATEPAPAVAAAAPAPSGNGGVWAHLTRIRACESHGNYGAVNPSGTFRGAYQFSRSTWNWVASRYAPHLVGVDPAAASPGDQDQMAYWLYTMPGGGPGHWPVCSRR